MDKFNRVYSLSVDVDSRSAADIQKDPLAVTEQVNIQLPYTLEFAISRHDLSSSQTGTFRIFGLGKNIRDAIQKDVFTMQQLRSITLRAGYRSSTGTIMPLMFNGTVLTAYSWRESTNWVTEISAYDGGFSIANAYQMTPLVAKAGTRMDATLKTLALTLPLTNRNPIIGDFPQTPLRDVVLSGNTWDMIQTASGNRATIDNGQVKILNEKEVFKNPNLDTISSDYGLLGSPKRTASTLEFDIVFEPRLSVGQIVALKSTTNEQFNRDWKVLGFDHHGTISPSVAGECRTMVRLWFTLGDLLPISDTLPVIR